VGLTNLGSESETCVGSRFHLVGVSISFEKNFYRLPFTPPLSGSPYRSFNDARGRFNCTTPPTSSSSGTVGGNPTLSSYGTDDAATSSSSSDGPHRQVDPSVKSKQALVGCKCSRSEVRYTALLSLTFHESCDSFCN
jgi:hypothetical protein